MICSAELLQSEFWLEAQTAVGGAKWKGVVSHL